jgi:transposase
MSWLGWIKRCRQLEAENRRLRERNAWLESRLAQVQAQNTCLVQSLAAAHKNSSTSSKPPSSDIVKPPSQRPQRKSQRRMGAQKGHPKHERPAFAPDQIHQRIPYRLDRCPVNPSHRIVPAEDRRRIIQQVELVKNPFRITEHIAYAIWCEDCHCYHDAPFPKEVVRAGLFGPRLTSLVAYLKGKIHSSYSGIRDFLQDVVGVKVSRGYVAKLLRKASHAFGQPYGQLIELLPHQSQLNTDETGHQENGQRYWIWCFRAVHFVLFKIDASRGTQVLLRILGEDFKGILGCDYYGAYRKYARQCGVLVQFCLAHLIRDIKYLCQFPDRSVQRYGTGLLQGLKSLFGTLHRKEGLSARAFAQKLTEAEEQIWEAALAPKAFPARFGHKPHRLIQNMVQRFFQHGHAYFQFITTPGIDPTNNLVEQAMRFVVIDRHVTQGTRSWQGREICERLWTVLATCVLQKRSAFDWIYQAITAYFKARPAPSLLLDSSSSLLHILLRLVRVHWTPFTANSTVNYLPVVARL